MPETNGRTSARVGKQNHFAILDWRVVEARIHSIDSHILDPIYVDHQDIVPPSWTL
jgi:hypothetical protein